jgi:hypothetical protein
MGLITPYGPDWAYCTHNLPSAIDASVVGVTCTSGTSNADGSAVALFSAALAHDAEYLRLMISGAMPVSGNNDLLMDVLIDPAGGTSWTEFIPYLITGALGGTESSGNNPSGPSARYDFPIWIPAGASLGIRARSAHSVASNLTVAAFAFGGNANPASWWCGQRVTGVGINAASSTGTAHTAGNSNSFSSWANLGSPLPAAAGALQFAVNGPGGTFYSQNAYQFEFGVGGARIGAPMFRVLTSNEVGWLLETGPILKKLPAGSQLQVRGSCSGTAQSLGVAAYAVH